MPSGPPATGARAGSPPPAIASLPRFRRSRAWRAASGTVKRTAPGAWARLTKLWGRGANALAPAEVWRDAVVGSFAARKHRERLAEVERFVIFVGFPRSGHSVVGAMLNAHPDMVVGHRMRVLRYVAARLRPAHLLALALVADERFERRGRVGSKRFVYSVPSGWQGRVRRLRVIGDSNASTSTLQRRPELFDQLPSAVQLPVRVVTVTRNPFDNISTISARNGLTLEAATEGYFGRCDTIASLCADRSPEDWLFVRHEDLIVDPRAGMGRLCDFLGVERDEDHLEACASIAYQKPNRSRDAAAWTPQLIAHVEGRLAAYPFLAGYRFDEHESRP